MGNSTCSVDGCDNDVRARGWCPRHYECWRVQASDEEKHGGTRRVCSVNGCDRTHDARGWCAMHRARVADHGQPGPAQPLHEHVVAQRGMDGDRHCKFCDHKASNRRALLKHSRRMHNDELPVPCESDDCAERFWNIKGRQAHMGQKHPDEVVPVGTRPEVRREYNLRNHYGIGSDEYDRMLDQQDGTCAACPAEDGDSAGRRLHVDHCHDTGEVRGLLCGNCNLILGKAGDSPARLRRLARYLEG